MEKFEFNENAYFYRVIEGAEMGEIIHNVLSDAIDDRKEGALYDKIERERHRFRI